MVAIAMPLLIAGIATAERSGWARWIAYGITRILDTIPLFLWLAIIFSAIDIRGFLGQSIAMVLVAFPFTVGIVLERFQEISNFPFVQNARSSGMSLYKRLFWFVVPNGISSVYYPAVVIFGLSLTFDAILGIMGLADRSTPSIGTLLWRAKERASVDPILSVYALATLALTIMLFIILKRLNNAEKWQKVRVDARYVSETEGNLSLDLLEFHHECVGIFGPSGIGKTTLIESIARASVAKNSEKILSYLPQNPRDLFPSQLSVESLIDTIAAGLADASAYKNRCRMMLKKLRLEPGELFQAPSSTLSGGEIQRAAAAILLAREPDIFLADEPSSSLDAENKDLFAIFLKATMEASEKLTILISSHDHKFIENTCDRILKLDNGELIEQESKIDFASIDLKDNGDSAESEPALDLSIHRHAVRSSALGKRQLLLPNFHHLFCRGKIYGVSGPSGIGKSTLLRIIADNETVTNGSISRFTKNNVKPICLLIPQDTRMFFDPKRTIEEYIRLLTQQVGKNLCIEALKGLMSNLELNDFSIIKRKPDQVSGGELQRISLAVALWLDPQLLCLDEIDTGVPFSTKSTISKVIEDSIRGSDKVAVIVSHDSSFLSLLSDEIIPIEG